MRGQRKGNYGNLARGGFSAGVARAPQAVAGRGSAVKGMHARSGAAGPQDLSPQALCMTDHPDKLPTHLAIIMDGNGRWAQARGLPREAGHRAGAETVRAIVTECRSLGIRHLTLYTFSSENWNRPKTEISALFSLLMEFLSREVPRMVEQGISMRVLGDLDSMPLAQRTALRHAIKRTEGGRDMVLNLALNYGGRGELVRAMQNMLREGLRPEDISEQTLADHLYTAGQPDPDLLIRTSGEQRLSNYLLYQCAYSELYFTPVPWPDFDAAQLRMALDAYAARSRRFGKTQEQIDAH